MEEEEEEEESRWRRRRKVYSGASRRRRSYSFIRRDAEKGERGRGGGLEWGRPSAQDTQSLVQQKKQSHLLQLTPLAHTPSARTYIHSCVPVHARTHEHTDMRAQATRLPNLASAMMRDQPQRRSHTQHYSSNLTTLSIARTIDQFDPGHITIVMRE